MNVRENEPGMRGIAVVVVIAAVVLGGCLGANEPSSAQHGTDAPPDQSLPPIPQQLNESSAEAFALAYERVRLTNWLAQNYAKDDYGVGCCTAPTFASTVLERSGTFYVRVQYAYYYTTASAEADGATHATYVISPDGLVRIDLRGRSISAEEPYVAANYTDNGIEPRLYLVNAASDDRDALIRPIHLTSGDSAFERRIVLDANESVGVSQFASRKGEYQLAVSASERTGQHRYTITDAPGGSIFVLFTGDETVIRHVTYPSNGSAEST